MIEGKQRGTWNRAWERARDARGPRKVAIRGTPQVPNRAAIFRNSLRNGLYDL